MFFKNPDYREEINTSKDCHYCSLVLGAKPLFDVLNNYYHEDDGKIVGIEIDESTLRVIFKNKEKDNSPIMES